MIFYTLLGPCHLAEIHDDKIILKKRLWFKLLSGPSEIRVWKLEDLCQFALNDTRPFFWGKIEWKTFTGDRGSFHFSKHPLMMKKIESYFQKMIIKNHQHHFALQNNLKTTKTGHPAEQNLAA